MILPTDQVLRSLDTILKSDEFEKIERIPIFDSHDEIDSRKFIYDAVKKEMVPNQDYGKVVQRYDKERLEKIAAIANERCKKGELIKIGPGHTSDDAKEEDQPPIWGYGNNVVVDRFGPDNTLGLLADAYIRKKHVEEVKTQYPGRSIEIWRGGPNINIVDWIGLLKRTPERPLGVVTYSKDTHTPVTLEADSPILVSMREAVLSKNNLKVRYSMEDYMEPNEAPKETPAEEMGENELDDQNKNMCMKYAAHMIKNHPFFKGMHAKYGKEFGEANGTMGEPAPDANGAPKPTNIPDKLPASEPTSPPAEKQRMSKETDDLARYAKEAKDAADKLAALQAQLAERDAQLKTNGEEAAKLKRENNKVRYAKAIYDLRPDLKDADVEELAEDCADMDQAGFDKEMKRFSKFTAQGPVGNPLLRLSKTVPQDGETVLQPDDEEGFEKIQRYMAQNKIEDWKEGKARYFKSKKTG